MAETVTETRSTKLVRRSTREAQNLDGPNNLRCD